MVMQWHLSVIPNNLEHYMKNNAKVMDRKLPLQPKENAGFQWFSTEVRNGRNARFLEKVL